MLLTLPHGSCNIIFAFHFYYIIRSKLIIFKLALKAPNILNNVPTKKCRSQKIMIFSQKNERNHQRLLAHFHFQPIFAFSALNALKANGQTLGGSAKKKKTEEGCTAPMPPPPSICSMKSLCKSVPS